MRGRSSLASSGISRSISASSASPTSVVERRRIGMARGRARHRDPAAGRFMQTERIGRTGIFEIDQMEAVGNHEADGARQLFGDILQPQPDQVAQLQAAHHRGAHRHRARADTIFLVARQIDELAHPGQRVGQARHRRSRQPAAVGNFQIAEPRLVALEAAQARRTRATPPESRRPRPRDRWRAFPVC